MVYLFKTDYSQLPCNMLTLYIIQQAHYHDLDIGG